MASFDFVEAASDGYKFIWNQRRSLIRLAAIPMLVKAVTLVFIIAFDMAEDYLRQGLVLIPAYFLEGVLVAQVIRQAVFDEQGWDTGTADIRRKALLGGAGVYLLTKLFISFMVGLGYQIKEVQVPESTGEPEASKFMFLVLLLALLIWAFRFLWLYVVPALGYSLGAFLKKIEGYAASLYMLGAFFLCYVPFEILNQISYEVLKVFVPFAEDGPGDSFMYARVPIISCLDVILALVVSVTMAFGFQAIMEDRDEHPDFF